MRIEINDMFLKYSLKKEVTLKDNTKCIIRCLCKNDAKEYIKCHLNVLENTNFCTYYPEELITDVDKIEKYLDEEYNNMYLLKLGAFIGDKLVGVTTISPYGYGLKLQHRANFSIMVMKEYSNNKVGYNLMKTVLELAKNYAFEVIQLDVVKENTTAIKLYKSFGFKEYGIFEKYFKNKDGSYSDNILMRLDLR